MNLKRIIKKIWCDFPAFNPDWKDNKEVLNHSDSAIDCFNFIYSCREFAEFQCGPQFKKSAACYDIINKNLDQALKSDSPFIKQFARLILKYDIYGR